MKYIRKTYQITIFIICISGITKAQVSAPKYSNEFLSIGVGARGMGMGNAVTSSTFDVTAGYWNPAALTYVKNEYEAAIMHSSFMGGISNYDYLGFATRIDSLSVLSASVIRLGIDDIPDTRFLYDANGAVNYDNIRFFSAADYAFLFSYGRALQKIDGLSVGGNLKIVHRKAGSFANAWGFGLDAAVHYRVGDWMMGLMVRDITTTFNAWTHNSSLLADVYAQTGNEIPETSIEITLPQAHFSISRRWTVINRFGVMPELGLRASFDGKRNAVIKSNVASVDPVAGLELDYNELAFVRLGVGSIQQIKDFDGSMRWSLRPQFGLGVHFRMITLDYALSDYGVEDSNLLTHVFSLKAGFNNTK